MTPSAGGRLALAAPLVLFPAASWTIAKPERWLALFLCAALLAPPLPFRLGDSGPHVAPVLAALGLLAGVIRLSEWRITVQPVQACLMTYLLVLVATVPLAAIYSGAAIAAASLARVALFGISVLVFFYVAHGPRNDDRCDPARWVRLVFWIGIASALFACVDFYLQLTPPAGFGPQFVWLSSGVYRRAQGVFYEASTLGNLCVFLLVMAATCLTSPTATRPVSRAGLVFGSAAISSALLLSFSRASLISLIVALATLIYLRRDRLRVARLGLFLAAMLAGSGLLVAAFLPHIGEFYWTRLWGTIGLVSTASGGALSGRSETWLYLLRFLAENPWHAILGVGYKTLPYSSFVGQPVIADNAYLGALIETGLVGLTVLVLLNYAILRTAFQAARNANPHAAFFGTLVACFWSGQVVQMMSGDLLTYWRVLPVYFWALAMAVRHQQ